MCLCVMCVPQRLFTARPTPKGKCMCKCVCICHPRKRYRITFALNINARLDITTRHACTPLALTRTHAHLRAHIIQDAPATCLRVCVRWAALAGIECEYASQGLWSVCVRVSVRMGMIWRGHQGRRKAAERVHT